MSGAWLLCPDCFYPMHYRGGESWKCFVCVYTKAPLIPTASIKWERPDTGKVDAPSLNAEPARDDDDEEDAPQWD